MSTSNDLSPRLGDVKTQAKETIRKVGDQLSEQANYLRDATATARYNTEDFIQNNPWQSVAIAAGIGLLVGIIVARR
ncbi:MAG TPA: hypothetical protein VGC39_11910 [Candidatus Methylacidiphilales bacterium]